MSRETGAPERDVSLIRRSAPATERVNIPRDRWEMSVTDFLVRLALGSFGCALSLGVCAQPYAAGEAVVIPGAEMTDWGRVAKVEGHFGKPLVKLSVSSAKVPAVLILHGSGCIVGRGAYYAKALQEAGIATLEITMFESGGRPRAGTKATIPFAAAALKWLAARDDVDRARLGVMGMSWGGVMTLLMSSA